MAIDLIRIMENSLVNTEIRGAVGMFSKEVVSEDGLKG